MYTSLSLELLMHPLLVLFTWQKHFRKYNSSGVYALNSHNYSYWQQTALVCHVEKVQSLMSKGCHNRARRPDSEHIIIEQYPNCVNYMVTITMSYVPYIVSRVGSILVWCHMAVCSLYIKLCTLM